MIIIILTYNSKLAEYVIVCVQKHSKTLLKNRGQHAEDLPLLLVFLFEDELPAHYGFRGSERL
jgi:hypothetical protein